MATVMGWVPASAIWRFFDGKRGATNCLVPRWLFLRALGLVYFSAFLSLIFQIRGLIGPAGNFTCRGLPAGGRTIARALGRVWYAPDCPVVVERIGHDEWAVLGGDCGVAPADAESVAARHADDLLRVFPVLRQRSAGIFRLPV